MTDAIEIIEQHLIDKGYDLSLTPAEKNLTEIYSTVKEIFVNFLKLGLLLYDCREHGYYNSAGHSRFKDFIEAIHLEWTQATRLVGIAELVLTQRIDSGTVLEIGYSKMCYLLPRFRNGTVSEDMVQLAKSAPQADLRRELGYKMPDNETDQFIVCSHCGAEIPFDRSILRKR